VRRGEGSFAINNLPKGEGGLTKKPLQQVGGDNFISGS